MYIINSSGKALEFIYNNQPKNLAPNEIFDVPIFETDKLNQLSKLIAAGDLMIYDDENEDLRYESRFNFRTPENKIIDYEASIYNNLNLDVD